METKNFLGLDGLKRFWEKAKLWIINEITTKIAEIVAEAPESFDTLKEISDWIKTHANDASAMNTQINTNKSDISALKTSVAGKADTGHTHTKAQITDFPKTVKFADYKTGDLTFSSLTKQKKIELSHFGPEVTENNVLSFMVICWSGIQIIASGDWAKSQGTGSSGLACALHSLNTGTGWCVIRCVYLA